MIPIGAAFLCNTLLFSFLLEEKYNLTATAAAAFLSFFASFIPAAILKAAVASPGLAAALAVWINVLILLLAFSFVSVNNLLQKLFLSVLCVSNYFFAGFAAESLLGIWPGKTAGWIGAVVPVLFYAVFSAFTGFCFYGYFHAFSGQNAALLPVVMLFTQLMPIVFIKGYLDFLFRAHIRSGRLLLASAFYLLIIFAAHSAYHAGKFKEEQTRDVDYRYLLEAESRRIAATMASVHEMKQQNKTYTYLFQTVSRMIAAGETEGIPEFIATQSELFQPPALLNHYDENRYLNAVIASQAALAEQAGILFESQSVLAPGCRIRLSEICLMADEMLQTAREKAETFGGEKKIAFTLSSTEDHLILETVFSAEAPAPEPSKTTPAWKNLTRESLQEIPRKIRDFYNDRLKGKKLSQITALLTEGREEEPDSSFLENTDIIISRYSGQYTISSANDVMIIRAVIDC